MLVLLLLRQQPGACAIRSLQACWRLQQQRAGCDWLGQHFVKQNIETAV